MKSSSSLNQLLINVQKAKIMTDQFEGTMVPPVIKKDGGREAIISQMVQKFLGWKLPKNFDPDCGISFKSESDYEHPEFGRSKYEPIGTNLFTADQAKQMFEDILPQTAVVEDDKACLAEAAAKVYAKALGHFLEEGKGVCVVVPGDYLGAIDGVKFIIYRKNGMIEIASTDDEKLANGDRITHTDDKSLVGTVDQASLEKCLHDVSTDFIQYLSNHLPDNSLHVIGIDIDTDETNVKNRIISFGKNGAGKLHVRYTEGD